MLRVGSVPYVNARPLVHALPQATVQYAVPSALPVLLDTGEVSAILVSSITLFHRPAAVALGTCGIVSQREVESVRLFSKVPFDKISSLSLDSSSMTSNALARIVLREAYGVDPDVSNAPPDQMHMLQITDACVLIGDIGMDSDAEGLYVLDLGFAWFELTRLPFVWALWISNRAQEELSKQLEAALESSGFGQTENLAAREAVIADACVRSGWPPIKARRYLENIMSYRIGPNEQLGLARFGELTKRHGL